MNCCDANGACQQGQDCPIRALHTANRDVFPLETGEGIKAQKEGEHNPPWSEIAALKALAILFVFWICIALVFFFMGFLSLV